MMMLTTDGATLSTTEMVAVSSWIKSAIWRSIITALSLPENGPNKSDALMAPVISTAPTAPVTDPITAAEATATIRIVW
jgi:hypothetical protein